MRRAREAGWPLGGGRGREGLPFVRRLVLEGLVGANDGFFPCFHGRQRARTGCFPPLAFDIPQPRGRHTHYSPLILLLPLASLPSSPFSNTRCMRAGHRVSFCLSGRSVGSIRGVVSIEKLRMSWRWEGVFKWGWKTRRGLEMACS